MKNQFKKKLSGGTLLLLSILSVNFINFVFNAYLGRVLSFEDFGLITLFTTFLYLATVPFNALHATVNHRSAYLIAQYHSRAGLDFLNTIKKKTYLIAFAISFLWLISIPVIDNFFQINNFIVPLLFTPIIILGFITAANKGFLQGSFNFKAVGIIILLEVLSKLLFAWILVTYNLNTWVYISIPLSVLVAFLLSFWLTPQKNNTTPMQNGNYTFPKKFFVAAIFTGFSSMAFLTFDLLLAKHFLPPVEAGQYALLSLIGKMIYFFGALPSVLMITYVSNDEGSNRDPKRSFYKLFSATIILSIGAFLVLGLFGQQIVPLLFGNKTGVILPYLTIYSAAITLFAISGSFISYHLARQHYLFPIVAILMAFIMSFGILIFHNNISQIAHVIFYVSLLSLMTTGFLHFLEAQNILKLKKGWLKIK